jgi:hypothetical protein
MPQAIGLLYKPSIIAKPFECCICEGKRCYGVQSIPGERNVNSEFQYVPGRDGCSREKEDWRVKSAICEPERPGIPAPARIEACLVEHFAERGLIEEIATPARVGRQAAQDFARNSSIARGRTRCRIWLGVAAL